MRDNEDKRRLERPDEDGATDTLDALLSSYTPTQREKVLKGLRILARVALRAHMERRWPGSTTPTEGEVQVEGGRTGE